MPFHRNHRKKRTVRILLMFAARQMKSLTEMQFLRWAEKHSIEIDDNYPKSAVLSFVPDPDLDRFWEIPDEPERRPYFIEQLLKGIGNWQSCYVWRHLGSWPDEPNYQRPNDKVEYRILCGIGLPMGTADIVMFERHDLDKLVTLIFSTTIFGWSVGEDLYVIPDNGQYIVKTDHHGVLHISFRNNDDLEKSVKQMKEAGFPLPGEIPDPTFKRPEWMK
jgi:hypothetical protein